jgi:hypothetical protein
MPSSGVPMFKMKPQRGTLWLSIIILMIGAVAYYDGHLDPGDIAAQDRSKLFLAISIVLSGVFMILATSRMWFSHLWHDRYNDSKRSRRSSRRKK